MYNITFFKEELALIVNEELRELVKTALEAAPKWFWSFTASWTGKHHPPDDNVEGGNCHHTAKVAWLAYDLFSARGLDPDVGMSAGLLHDIAKYGFGDEADVECYKRHGAMAAMWLLGYSNAAMSAEVASAWYAVIDAIESHMGKFGDFPPETDAQWLLHYADKMSSHKSFVALKFYNPDAAPAIPDVRKQGKLYLDGDDWRINFGKNKGSKLSDIAGKGTYLGWMLDKVTLTGDERAAITAAINEYGNRLRARSTDSLF